MEGSQYASMWTPMDAYKNPQKKDTGDIAPFLDSLLFYAIKL